MLLKARADNPLGLLTLPCHAAPTTDANGLAEPTAPVGLEERIQIGVAHGLAPPRSTPITQVIYGIDTERAVYLFLQSQTHGQQVMAIADSVVLDKVLHLLHPPNPSTNQGGATGLPVPLRHPD